MSFDWPEHPLFNQLKLKAAASLPELNFEILNESEGHVSMINNDGLIVKIQHEGYDMPCVYLGNKNNTEITKSWGPLEYFWNKETPVFKKHEALQSFYDLEFDMDLISTYQQEVNELISSPESFLSWLDSADLEVIFAEIKG